MLSYYRMLVRRRRFVAELLSATQKIDVPTLMVWGEEDVALTKETTFGTERFVSDLTVRYLPGISHWVQQDDPETVNRILETWLTGQPIG